jgi:RNA polymerase sigma factor (sigma-70 family)
MDARQQLSDLVQRCQQGDHTAFEAVFREFQPRLAYYFQRLNPVRQGTDDLIQEVWIKVLRKIRTLKDPQAFVAWLYRIARNELFTRTGRKPRLARTTIRSGCDGG